MLSPFHTFLSRAGNETLSNYSQIAFLLCHSAHINHALSIFHQSPGPNSSNIFIKSVYVLIKHEQENLKGFSLE